MAHQLDFATGHEIHLPDRVTLDEHALARFERKLAMGDIAQQRLQFLMHDSYHVAGDPDVARGAQRRFPCDTR